jgi:hypothetical protein
MLAGLVEKQENLTDIKIGYVYIDQDKGKDKMTKEFWLVCVECYYTKKVYSETEICYNESCPICRGKMTIDLNRGKAIEEPTGDNFPKIPDMEREMRDSIGTIGMGHTWYMIEVISDIKLRLQYRELFFKCGGKIPEREE